MKETRDGVGKSLLRVFFFNREGKFRSMIISLKQLCQPCFHKIKNIYELQSLMKKSLYSQELSLAETKVKELAVLR